MFRKIIVLSAFTLLVLLTPGHAQNTWVAREGAVKNSELKAAIYSRESLYIATKNALYRAKDIKEKWEPVFSLPSSGNNEINCLAGRAGRLFVGTKRGLFRSDDEGAMWKNIFKTLLPDRNNITYIELSRHSRSRILLATEKGIFISEDLGARWQDISASLKNTSVKCIALNKESIYAGTESGLYIRRADFQDWEKIFVRSSGSLEKPEETEDSALEYEDAEKDASIRCISINDTRVYAGFNKEIMYTDDTGKSWNNLAMEGLRGSINYILISPRNAKVYCATDRGVFEFDSEKSRWLELYKGMTKSLNVTRLIFGSEDEKTLLAVTDKGLYSFEGGDYMMDKYPDIENSLKTLKITLDGEPTYKELQRAAIKFCDVSPEKIRKWHMESRARALLPKISLGIDKDSSTTYDIYTSSDSNKSYSVTGPDDISNGWNVGLSWDVGNLIWSDDQTNIDVRSRLTTQLRNDILDDLRRVYYERKRLQFELMSNPPKDMNVKFEKELRLQELTQAIDDLTGNYFSEHLLRRKK